MGIKLLMSLLISMLFASEAPKAPEAPVVEVPAWVELEAKVAETKSKINSKEEGLKKIFQDKRNAKTPEEATTVVSDLQKEHKELNQLVIDYDKLRQQLFFQYPDRLKKKGAELRKIKTENIEVLQQRLDVNSKLDQAGKRIEKAYQKSVKNADLKSKTHSNGKIDSNTSSKDEGVFKPIEVKK